DRGADPRAAGIADHRDRHPQHAAGGARLRRDGLLLPRRAGRARPHGADLHQSPRAPHRGLRDREVRMKAHTDRTYDAQLEDLRHKLLTLGGKVETEIASSMRALSERDSKLAEDVIAQDREVNRLEVEIDEACRRLLVLRQPAASDLRFITTALKIVVDLERI